MPTVQRPVMAPPFPPIEHLLAQRRRWIALGATILLALVIGTIWWIGRGEPPPAAGITGVPLRGLSTVSADAALAAAPGTVFQHLEWDAMNGVRLSDTDAAAAIIPGDLQALDGRPISVTGFMVPLDAGRRTLDFVIVPDMGRCWFCEAPDPERTVYCRGAFGPVEAEYDRPVRAFGVLSVGNVASGDQFHSALRLRVVRLEKL